MKLGTTSHVLLCVWAICPTGLKPFCFPSVFPDSLLSPGIYTSLWVPKTCPHPSEPGNPSFFPKLCPPSATLLGLGNFRDPPAFSKVRNFPYCCFSRCSAPTGLLLEECLAASVSNSCRNMAVQGFSQQNCYCRLFKHSSAGSLNSFSSEQ